MIVRILGEDQFDIAGEYLGELNLLDARLQSADEADDEAAFTARAAGPARPYRAVGGGHGRRD